MKTADGSFHCCYNAQAVVDKAHQVIIATSLTQAGTDVGQLVPMMEEIATELEAADIDRSPRMLLADDARRKAIVEAVFGQMNTRQHAGALRLRSLELAEGEWILHALVHNLRKLANAGPTAMAT